MRKVVRMAAVVAVLAIIAAACSDSGTPESSPSGSTGGAEIQAGGTLHLAQTSDVASAFDPQKEYYQVSWEYYRCCLVRTLAGDRIRPRGRRRRGAQARPGNGPPDRLGRRLDLHVHHQARHHVRPSTPRRGDHRAGLHPCARARVRSQGQRRRIPVLLLRDRRVRRLRCGQGGLHLRTVGPRRPDVDREAHGSGRRYAVAFHDAGDRPYPAEPGRPRGAPRRGRRSLHRLWTVPREQWSVHVRGEREPGLLRAGEGSGARRATCPAARSSWSATLRTIPPRTVCVRRIRTGSRPRSVETPPTSSTRSLTGDVDYVNDVGDVPANVLQEYSTNPDLQQYLHTYQQNAVTYISMNLGVPPFDDVHVRKALNYAYDKAGGRQWRRRAHRREPPHLPGRSPRQHTEGLQPYATTDDHGDLALTQADMATVQVRHGSATESATIPSSTTSSRSGCNKIRVRR